jgi:hypothetical protein
MWPLWLNAMKVPSHELGRDPRQTLRGGQAVLGGDRCRRRDEIAASRIGRLPIMAAKKRGSCMQSTELARAA